MKREGLNTITVRGRVRFVATLALACAMIAAFAAFRTDEVTLDAAEQMLSTERLEWRHCCDTVIIGDSRAQLGLSPAEIEAILPGSTVRNFGFGSAPLADPYIARAEELFVPDGPRRMIVCVSPRALTHQAQEQNLFQMLNETHEQQRALLEEPFMVGPLRPVNLAEVKLRIFGGDDDGKRTWELHPDGWVAVSMDPPDPQDTIPEYRELFAKQQVSPEAIDAFLARVQRWREEDVRVYGLRMPVTQEMAEIEDSGSGLDWTSFAERFVAAGGVWLDVEMTYASFDGSHLCEESAREFSREIARRMAAHEAATR